jgi:hypothetical protein
MVLGSIFRLFSVVVVNFSLLYSQLYDRWSTFLDIKAETDNWGCMERLETFAFEPIKLSQERDPKQRDLVLFLPDSIYIVDQDKRDAWHVSYDFCVNQK